MRNQTPVSSLLLTVVSVLDDGVRMWAENVSVFLFVFVCLVDVEGGVIVGSVDGSEYVKYMERVFELMEEFNEGAIDRTEREIDQLAVDVVEATVGSQIDVSMAWTVLSYRNQTKLEFKAGCDQRVKGTPTYFVNGVLAPEAELFTTPKQWQMVFKNAGEVERK